MPDVLALFDVADPNGVTAQWNDTTVPPQAEVDRALSSYESYVWIPDRADDRDAALVTVGEVLP